MALWQNIKGLLGPGDTAYTDAPPTNGTQQPAAPAEVENEWEKPRRTESDEELLEEIRDRYKAYDAAWSKNREERAIDLRYITGDPWDPLDRDARDAAGRPCISHDELSQYVNQCVNSVRQSRRSIKVDPRGTLSTDQSAVFRQDLIRTIEYDTNAPSIYCSAFQQMVEGGYSFFRIGRRYMSDDADSNSLALFQQEIVVSPIPNADSVLFDPHCKEPDWSDGKACFVIERMPRKEFEKRWPKAQRTDFAWRHRDIAPGWITLDDIVVAEYWRIETRDRMKYLLGNGTVSDRPNGRVIEKRLVPDKFLVQYLTNGVEILERKGQPGTILPIIPMIGLERFIPEGPGSRRLLFSLVRLARDPQLSLAYLTSQEMEEAGLSPKAPFMGYKGQFDSSKEQWTKITKIPYAYLEADVPDNWPAGQIPPLPQRVPFTPNFQAYEIAKDSCRRAIQSAMGIIPLPTSAQRANQKSGIALSKIQEEQAIGSYHFVDAYDRGLRLAGKVMLQWINAIYRRQQTLHLRKPDGKHIAVQINTPAYQDAQTGQMVHYPIEEVDHSVSISTGPSYASQRDAVDDFLNNLIANLAQLPIPPPAAAKLLSIAIKMKNLGPGGDEMAELISPTQPGADQSMAQLQQATAQVQQQAILIQQLQAALQQLQVEKQAKVVEGEYKLLTEKMRTEANLLVERLKVDAQMATAEIQTKSQILSERQSAVNEAQTTAREQLHEVLVQEKEQQHELRLAQQEYQQQLLEVQQRGQQNGAATSDQGSASPASGTAAPNQPAPLPEASPAGD